MAKGDEDTARHSDYQDRIIRSPCRALVPTALSLSHTQQK